VGRGTEGGEELVSVRGSDMHALLPRAVGEEVSYSRHKCVHHNADGGGVYCGGVEVPATMCYMFGVGTNEDSWRNTGGEVRRGVWGGGVELEPPIWEGISLCPDGSRVEMVGPFCYEIKVWPVSSTESRVRLG